MESPAPKIAPATWSSAVDLFLAMVQLRSSPVGLPLSQTPPPLLPKAVFSAMVTFVSWALREWIQIPPL